MDTQLTLKKTPAHLAMQSQGADAVGTAQGGENSRQVAGLHDGGSARAHNWIASAKAVRLVRREVVIAHVAPLFGSNEHERDQSQDGAHHVQQQVQFSGGDGLHGSGLQGEWRDSAVVARWKYHQPPHEREPHGKRSKRLFARTRDRNWTANDKQRRWAHHTAPSGLLGCSRFRRWNLTLPSERCSTDSIGPRPAALRKSRPVDSGSERGASKPAAATTLDGPIVTSVAVLKSNSSIARLPGGVRLLARHGKQRAARHAASGELLNDFAVVGFAGPFGAGKTASRLPLSDGLSADAKLSSECAKPNSFNGLSDWVRIHANQSN